MKFIHTNGVCYITEIQGSNGWYWCCDYASGDLYEAEELYRSNQPFKSNRLTFVHYPDGSVVEPVTAKEGQYLGCPAFENGKLQILLVDFPASKICIFQYDPETEQTDLRVELPLAEVRDCYNLLLKNAPLMLTRQGAENTFQVLWPEKTSFPIGDTEAFDHRDGEKLYFNRWLEERDFQDEVVVRQYPSGEILEVIQGVLFDMPDGHKWILQ